MIEQTHSPRSFSQSAKGELGLGREQPQGAVEAGGHARQNDSCMALQPLGPPIDHGLDGAGHYLATIIKFCTACELRTFSSYVSYAKCPAAACCTATDDGVSRTAMKG